MHYQYRGFINSTIMISLCLLLTQVVLAEGEVLTGTDKDAKLPFWEWRDDVVSLRLVQRLPDQTRAFFMGRGFSREHAELIAQSCIFQTVYKNISTPASPSVIEYDLTQWKVLYKGKALPLKTKEVWQEEWNKLKTSQTVQIAFLWSLIPTQQRYEPQDYNWGMTSYNLPPGEKFDLEITWRQDGVKQTALIRNIQCAPDIHLEPKEPFG
ncbi:hypothetical protein [Kaarinaea lacus]